MRKLEEIQRVCFPFPAKCGEPPYRESPHRSGTWGRQFVIRVLEVQLRLATPRIQEREEIMSGKRVERQEEEARSAAERYLQQRKEDISQQELDKIKTKYLGAKPQKKKVLNEMFALHSNRISVFRFRGNFKTRWSHIAPL